MVKNHLCAIKNATNNKNQQINEQNKKKKH